MFEQRAFRGERLCPCRKTSTISTILDLLLSANDARWYQAVNGFKRHRNLNMIGQLGVRMLDDAILEKQK